MSPSEYLTKFSSALASVETTCSGYDGGTTIAFGEGVERVIEFLQRARASKKKVMLVGNGAEASIASHFALDLWKVRGVRAVTFSDPVQLTALANDCGSEFEFSTPIKIFGDPGDVVVAMSCSGESQNVLNATYAARKAKHSLLTLTGFEPTNALRKMGDVNIYVPDGAYGIVESVHALIMHCILDCITKENE